METGLGGRTVVTGATANIGRGIALAFAAEESQLVVVGRDEAQGRRVCGQLLERGAEDALWQQCDVTDRPQVDAMADAVRELDFALNIMSTLHCTQAVLPMMIGEAAAASATSDRHRASLAIHHLRSSPYISRQRRQDS